MIIIYSTRRRCNALQFSPLSPFFGRKSIQVFILISSLFIFNISLAQEEKKPFLDDFSGTASVTNNGISLIPSFSLGDPALIFDLKFKKGRLSFEPDMRFALEGKPWTFIFGGGTKLLKKRSSLSGLERIQLLTLGPYPL